MQTTGAGFFDPYAPPGQQWQTNKQADAPKTPEEATYAAANGAPSRNPSSPANTNWFLDFANNASKLSGSGAGNAGAYGSSGRGGFRPASDPTNPSAKSAATSAAASGLCSGGF